MKSAVLFSSFYSLQKILCADYKACGYQLMSYVSYYIYNAWLHHAVRHNGRIQ